MPADAAPSAPLVSVVIPCYRAAHFVGDALDSVMAQEGPSLEALVVDDGSPDGAELRRVVAGYRDAPWPVRLVAEPHRGLPATRNAGITAARGSLVAFLDADDCWLPGFLEAQVALLESAPADLVYCDAVFFGDTGKDGHTVMEWHPSAPVVTLESVLAGESVPVMSTIVARIRRVREVGAFDPGLVWGEDFELWARMLAGGCRFAWSPEVRARRRIHDSNMSHDTLNMALGQIDVIRRHAPASSDGRPRSAAVRRRLRHLDRTVHLARARHALETGDHDTAGRELWLAWQRGGVLKHAVGALALALAPRAAGRFLARRMEHEP